MAKGKKEQLSLEELLEEAIIKEEDRPYEVPGNWVWTTLEHIVEIRTGKEDANFASENGKYNFFTCAESPLKCDIAAFSGESILIAGNGMFHVNYFHGDFNAYQRTYVIQKFRAVLGKYLYYFIIRSIEEITKNNRGSTIKYIRLGDLTDAKIAIPPILEQQRIVEIMESLFEKLDTAKELVQNALDSFESRKSAILHKAFTGELTAIWREEKGVSLEEWEEKSLKSVCKISSGGTPSRKNQEYYNGEIPWIKTGEITWNYINDSEEKITECAIENSSAKLFPKGTVLVAMYGQGLTRGRAAILDIEATTNQAVCALIPNSKLLNKYLYYYFMCNYWRLREKAVGGNQPNFSATIIGGFMINIPSLNEQEEIVRILDDLLEKERCAKELYDVIEKIDLMKKAILARAFRGELGTNNPEEESAVELLKEVLKEKMY